ncbi:MAG TPA: hypothetical protein VN782_17770 [Usitatibacter sp.]|nr:hypothetical protein [Usitatibacter sp.]
MRREAALAAAPAIPESRPGRTCPISYRYPPRVLDRAPQIEAETLYAIGGLYGNPEALDAVLALAEREPGEVRLVFNGDFHWFDTPSAQFARIAREVAAHAALRGNVETELAAEESGAGCGCAYPADVSDAEVSRSNEILARLRETARRDPALRAALGELPMHLVARVGDARIGIVHGDAASLAGWGFAHDRLDDPRHRRWIENAFRDARVDAFACSHTCIPALRRFEVDGRSCVVANNGAAGMPNFAGSRHGLLTRISTRPFEGSERAYGLRSGEVAIDAIAIEYDHERWVERFLAAWPEGSPAHASYHRRIVEGPRHAADPPPS